MTMTVAQAIKRARGRVSICPQGGQYVLHSWSPLHNATYVSHSMDYWSARAAQREGRIRKALEALEVEDAAAVANGLADEGGTWTELVRAYARKR